MAGSPSEGGGVTGGTGQTGNERLKREKELFFSVSVFSGILA